MLKLFRFVHYDTIPLFQNLCSFFCCRCHNFKKSLRFIFKVLMNCLRNEKFSTLSWNLNTKRRKWRNLPYLQFKLKYYYNIIRRIYGILFFIIIIFLGSSFFLLLGIVTLTITKISSYFCICSRQYKSLRKNIQSIVMSVHVACPHSSNIFYHHLLRVKLKIYSLYNTYVCLINFFPIIQIYCTLYSMFNMSTIFFHHKKTFIFMK